MSAYFGRSATRALLTAGIHAAGDVLVFKDKMDMALVTDSGISFVSDLVAEPISGIVIPYLVQSSDQGTLAIKNYIHPMLSGAVYVAAKKSMGRDRRGMLESFLLQAGSSAISNYLTQPIVQ